jgi:hypothetical protein
MGLRWAANVDRTHRECVEAAESVGASVLLIFRLKKCPDLLVGFRGVDQLLEVKPEGEDATDEQLAWHRRWQGRPVKVVHNAQETLRAIGALR